MTGKWTRPLFQLVLALCLFAGLMCAGLMIEPPPLRAANAPGEFDAVSAQHRLARILGDETPHPVDSDHEDVLRARLLHEIAVLGFHPEVRDQFSCRTEPHSPLVTCARVRNIVFSIGPSSGPSILAASHYDSVPAGPGASDDGIGLAAQLETARVLSKESLTRRVIFLISDGEELGLLGAHAFAKGDPLMQSVQAVVNLEARGTRGPAIFFETNRPNADAINAYAAGVSRPLANSIMADVYALLPDSTDITALNRPGLDVINIALLDGVENYHTPRDALAAFEPRSLQHMGDAALGATRYFATHNDAGAPASLAFTDIASRVFVAVPEWMSRLGIGFGALCALAVFLARGREQRWSALGLPPLVLAATIAVAAGLGFAIALTRGEGSWFGYPEATRAWCVMLALFISVLVFALFGQKLAAEQKLSGAMLWFSLIGLIGSLFLPGLSILFLAPVLIYAGGAGIALLWKPAFAIGGVAAGAAALIIGAPILYLTELALGFGLPAVNAALSALLVLPWLGVLTNALAPNSRRIVIWPIAIALAACLGLAALAPRASLARPQPLNITYLRDVAQQKAYFLAGSARAPLPLALARATHFEPMNAYPGDRRQSWAAPAPYQAGPAPAFAIETVEHNDRGRTVHGVIHANGADRVSLRIPVSESVSRVVLEGAQAAFPTPKQDDEYVTLVCQGRTCEGARLDLYLGPAAQPADWFVIGQYLGAPASAAALVLARPPEATPIQFGDSRATLAHMRLPSE